MTTEPPPRPTRAEFFVRERCIACQSPDCITLDKGVYSSGIVRTFFEEDPWGASPLPSLEDAIWEFVQCRQCGQMFHKRILTKEWNEVRFRDWMSGSAIHEFEKKRGQYEPSAVFERTRGSVEHVLRLERMTRSLNGAGAVRLLDFGSGWGHFIDLASEFGFKAYGVERAPARQRFSPEGGRMIFADHETARAAVPEGFHAVTLFQVLEHLDAPLETLGLLREMTVSGGVLVVEVPNCEGIRGIKNSSDYRAIHPLEHINAFTPRSLRGMCERAGFRLVRPPIVHVTSDVKRVLRREARRALRLIMKPDTHQYFRRD